jgi:short-subunit dehydrogenase
LLWTQPDRVAKEIYRAIERKKDVAYVPSYWRYVMLIIKAVPEGYFKRLRL